jgi:acyl-lipid omega-6 desaturase (Delta-12 desaturase)
MAIHIADSMPKIIRKIPAHCLESNLARSVSYLIRDYAICILLVTAIAMSQSWIFGPIFGLLLGLQLTGLFVIGHDAAHRSFSKNNKINDFVGHLTTTLTYWPFHVWRLSHDIHHRSTHHIEKDIAWVPFTFEKYKRWPKSMQFIYLHTRTTLYFIGSAFFTWYFIKDGRRQKKSTHFKSENELKQIRFSLRIMYLWLLVSVGSAIYFYGIYGFVCFILIPQIGFHFWLSTFTLFHHTHKDVHFMSPEEWTMEKAQLASTIHVDYPKVVEWTCHDINWHVPHHVCVGIPHYHLREAHNALKLAYGEIVREEKLNPKLIREVITQCHFIRSKTPPDMTWRSKTEEEKALNTGKRPVFSS